jgi:hypothetical protein
MQPIKSNAYPIHPGFTAAISSNRVFGSSPYRGLSGGANPAFRSYKGYSGCDCGPVGGCNCSSLSGYSSVGVYDPGRAVFKKRGVAGLGQSVSLDQMIQNAASWLGGFAQSQLPASAAVPPQYGSTGALATSLTNLAPWLIGGFLIYKLIK